MVGYMDFFMDRCLICVYVINVGNIIKIGFVCLVVDDFFFVLNWKEFVEEV